MPIPYHVAADATAPLTAPDHAYSWAPGPSRQAACRGPPRASRLLRLAVIAAIWGALALAALLLWFARDLPRPESALDAARRPSLTLQDRQRPRLRHVSATWWANRCG